MRHRHKILKPLAKDLYLCTDQRATLSPKFEPIEGGKGGAGYEYYGYENSFQKVAKNQRRLERKALSIIAAAKEVRRTGTLASG